MCYDGALVMPSSYAVMDEEEMTYVEGGAWSTYTGNYAIIGITCMLGASYTCGSAVAKLGKALCASACSGWGLVIAIACAVGISVLTAAAAYQVTLAVCAAALMIQSYRKYGTYARSGYKADAYSMWTYSLSTQVAPL